MRTIKITMALEPGLIGGVTTEVSTEVIVTDDATDADIEMAGYEAGSVISKVLKGMANHGEDNS